MPAIRTPLRERCNIQLKVWTAIPAEVCDDFPSCDDDDGLFFGGRALGKKPTPDVRVPWTKGFNAPNKLSFDITGPALHPLTRMTARGLVSLHKLVPRIFLALHTGTCLPRSLTTENGAAFTHIVQIAHPAPTREAGAIDLHLDAKRGLHVLILPVLPTSPVTDSAGTPGRSRKIGAAGRKRTKMVLTENQLLAARDFLSLALPYFSKARCQDDMPIAGADNVRVLVTAPVGDRAAADVMTAVLCYLTYTSRKNAATVVGCIKAEHGIPVVWRDGMCLDGLGFIERVAWMGE